MSEILRGSDAVKAGFVGHGFVKGQGDPPANPPGKMRPQPRRGSSVAESGAVVTFFVEGRPAPKGSKKLGAHGQVIEMSKYIKDWVEVVAMSCWGHKRFTAEIPLRVETTFYLRRGWRTPDGDKLTRGVWDGLQAGRMIVDDKYIVEWSGSRLRAADPAGRYGCLVTVRDVGAEHEW